MRVHRRVAHLSAFLLAGPVARYIRTQRDRLAEHAVDLELNIRNEFRPYFERELLDHARVVTSESTHLPAIPFETALRKLGMCIPSTQLVAAITFDDLIAMREPPSRRLLFHELVHVAQFRILGTSKFARLYVRGFLVEGSYDRIPLERCASALEERFLAGGKPFSVEGALASWIDGGLF